MPLKREIQQQIDALTAKLPGLGLEASNATGSLIVALGALADAPGDRDRSLPLGGCNQKLERRTLREFQRWAIRKAYNFIPFEHYDVNAKGRAVTEQLELLSRSQRGG